MYKYLIANDRPAAYYELAGSYHPIRLGAVGALHNGTGVVRPNNYNLERAYPSTESKPFAFEVILLPLYDGNYDVFSNGETGIFIEGDEVSFHCGSEVKLNYKMKTAAQHIFASYDGSHAALYIDGEIVGSAEFTGSFTSTVYFTLMDPTAKYAVSDLALYKTHVTYSKWVKHVLAMIDNRPESQYSVLNYLPFEDKQIVVTQTALWPGGENETFNEATFDGSLVADQDGMWQAGQFLLEETNYLVAEVDSDSDIEYSWDDVSWVTLVDSVMPTGDRDFIFLRSNMVAGDELRKVSLQGYESISETISGTSINVSFGSAKVYPYYPPVVHEKYTGIEFYSDLTFGAADFSSLSLMIYITDFSDRLLLSRSGSPVAIAAGAITGPATANGGRGLLPGWNLIEMEGAVDSVTVSPARIAYLTVSTSAVDEYNVLFANQVIAINDSGPTISTANMTNLYSIDWSVA